MGSYIARLIWIPQREELVERPLDSLDPLLLTLGSIFVGECQRVYIWPVGQVIKVQKAQIGEKQRDI